MRPRDRHVTVEVVEREGEVLLGVLDVAVAVPREDVQVVRVAELLEVGGDVACDRRRDERVGLAVQAPWRIVVDVRSTPT